MRTNDIELSETILYSQIIAIPFANVMWIPEGVCEPGFLSKCYLVDFIPLAVVSGGKFTRIVMSRFAQFSCSTCAYEPIETQAILLRLV